MMRIWMDFFVVLESSTLWGSAESVLALRSNGPEYLQRCVELKVYLENSPKARWCSILSHQTYFPVMSPPK